MLDIAINEPKIYRRLKGKRVFCLPIFDFEFSLRNRMENGFHRFLPKNPINSCIVWLTVSVWHSNAKESQKNFTSERIFFLQIL